MTRSPLNFETLSDGPTAETMLTSRFRPPRGVTAGIASLLLALAIATGIDIAHDYHRQSDALQAQAEKRQLALLGELELGHAVQDFKDCLLRNDSSYCDDFDRHIQAVDRTVSQYAAQGTQQPDEMRVLGALRPALTAYQSAFSEVRAMQGRHATIQEIDGVVKGEDRPIAVGLSELAVLSLNRDSRWHMPLRQASWLMIFISLAGLSLYFVFRSSMRRSHETAQLVRQLSNRMMEWEEDKKAKAFERLHDGVCQSLAAIMYLLRSAQRVAAGGEYLLTEVIPEPVIPSLQAVIQDARAVALQLRPPRMQEAGLLATLNSLCVDSRALYPTLLIKPRALIEERDIPEDLKPVILRIAQMTLDFGAQYSSACRVAWLLERSGEMLRLSIDIAVDAHASPQKSPQQPSPSTTALNPLEAIRARVALSGGSSEWVTDVTGRTTIVCTWQG
jgi:signal transduction histidine kinase